MTKRSPKNILLVEDEAHIAIGESKKLTEEGYGVIVVATGEEAIETVRDRANEIDLILMDINLGRGLNGAETAREILKDRDIPILFLSSHNETEGIKKTNDIFSYGFVVKDAGFSALQASVNMAFRLHQAHLKQHQTEKKLRASESFNFALFQYNPIQTVIVDREGRVVKANLAKRQSGVRIPKIGDAMYVDYAAKHSIDMRSELMASIASGKPVQFKDLPYKEKILQIFIAPFPEGAIIASQDVTEQVLAEEKIRLSEQRLALAQKAAGAGVWNRDLVRNHLYMSPELYQILGREPEDPEDSILIWDTAIFPEDRTATRRHMDDAVKNRTPLEDEYRILLPDGRIRWLRTMGSATYDSAGRPVRLDGICIDITDLKFRENIRTAVYRISEAALQAETIEEIFRALHQIVSTLIPAENFYIAIYDPEKKTLSFPYFVDEYDEAPSSYPIGRGLTEYVLFHGEPLHADPVKCEELEKSGEVVLIGPPSADWLGVPLKIHDQTIGVMVVQTYVAGASYREEDKDMLMFVSGQAAIPIERKRSEKALQALVKQKEVLLRELQHRTKNSLALVSSLLGLERENLPDARSREIFSKTRSRISSIASVYGRLSDAGNYESVDLHLYIREIAEAVFRSFAPDTGTILLKTKLDEMKLDPKRAVTMGLILNELVVNALKYGFPKKASGEIRLELKKSEGRIVLEVSDNGVGVPLDLTPDNAPGTGLSIVQILTEQIEGELKFRIDHGTNVQLSFTL